jgi:hypothetical protein
MIKLAGYFQGFASKTDGSASLRFATQEIDGEEFANLKRNQGQFGWIVFSENENEEIPEEAVEEEGKTSSQRLRDRMFVYWKNKVNKGDFELWRKNQIDILGQRYLDKLD